MGTRVVHYRKDSGWVMKSHAYRDDSIPDLAGFHSEAYVCGDLPPHYPVPTTIRSFGGAPYPPVEIFPDRVLIWENAGNGTVYSDGRLVCPMTYTAWWRE